jgi:hypothetical protein
MARYANPQGPYRRRRRSDIETWVGPGEAEALRERIVGWLAWRAGEWYSHKAVASGLIAERAAVRLVLERLAAEGRIESREQPTGDLRRQPIGWTRITYRLPPRDVSA